METIFIEATEPTLFNWGKFMVGRFDRDEWDRRSTVGGRPMLRERGWDEHHFVVFDLQTGEGGIFRHGGLASHDLNKHRVWVCPMFEPFLQWLYQQDICDLSSLPRHVELPEGTPTSMAGYRRPGPSEAQPETSRG